MERMYFEKLSRAWFLLQEMKKTIPSGHKEIEGLLSLGDEELVKMVKADEIQLKYCRDMVIEKARKEAVAPRVLAIETKMMIINVMESCFKDIDPKLLTYGKNNLEEPQKVEASFLEMSDLLRLIIVLAELRVELRKQQNKIGRQITAINKSKTPSSMITRIDQDTSINRSKIDVLYEEKYLVKYLLRFLDSFKNIYVVADEYYDELVRYWGQNCSFHRPTFKGSKFIKKSEVLNHGQMRNGTEIFYSHCQFYYAGFSKSFADYEMYGQQTPRKFIYFMRINLGYYIKCLDPKKGVEELVKAEKEQEARIAARFGC